MARLYKLWTTTDPQAREKALEWYRRRGYTEVSVVAAKMTHDGRYHAFELAGTPPAYTGETLAEQLT